MFNNFLRLQLLIAFLTVFSSIASSQKSFRFFSESSDPFALIFSVQPLGLKAQVESDHELPASFTKLDLQFFRRFRIRGLYGQAAAPQKLHPVIKGTWGRTFGYGFDFSPFRIPSVLEFHFHFERRWLEASYDVEIFDQDHSQHGLYRRIRSRGEVKSEELVLGIGIRVMVWKGIGVDFVPLEFIRRERGVFTEDPLYRPQMIGFFGPTLFARNTKHTTHKLGASVNVFIHLASFYPPGKQPILLPTE